MAASSLAFLADGTSGTVEFDQGAQPLTFNGNVGGGEFGALNFSNPSVLAPISSPVQVTGFQFQTFCAEHDAHIEFHKQYNYTISTTTQLLDGSTRHLKAATAYLYTKFWTNGLFPADPYAYTPLGAARSASAGDMQLAMWFTEGDSNYAGPLGSPLHDYIDEAIAQTTGSGSWALLYGDDSNFPACLGNVRVLNLIDPTNGARAQDVLVRLADDGPPPPPKSGGDPGPHVGYTPGYWHNKNGAKTLKANLDCIDVIAAMNLVNKNGTAFNPTDVNDVTGWINKADATNMASKLSSQLAAMALNICVGFVDPDSLVYTGSCADEFGGATQVKIGDVVSLANTDLGIAGHNIVTAAGPIRDRQECLKDVLDAANNNSNWVP
jgi:hypothetical protein